MNETFFGARLKALREGRGLSQEELARVFGFENRQTVTQIETGKRKLSAQELMTALTYFDVPVEKFTNPYLLSGSARFSWRQQDVSSADLVAFEERAGEWIGAFREFSRQNGETLPAIMPRLGLTYKSSFEEAEAAGEAVSKQLELGDRPASRLAEVMEEKLGILVLTVDAIPGVSGAACTLPELNAVIVNRHDPEPRRNFDLAHELFHLMTWDTMPPQWMDGQVGGDGARGEQRKRIDRIEQLANKFAAGLLMPTAALDGLGTPDGDLVSWINAASAHLGVSSTALKWQLVNARRGPPELAGIPDEAFRSGRVRSVEDIPAPFGRRFVERVARAISRGHVSARRAAQLLDMTLDDLAELCETFGIERPDELRLGRVAGY